MTYIVSIFICLFANHMSSLVRGVSRSLDHSFTRLLIFLLSTLSSFIRYIFYKYLLCVRVLTFHSLDSVFLRARVVHFNEVSLLIVSFLDHAFGVASKSHCQNKKYICNCQTQSHLDFLLCSEFYIWLCDSFLANFCDSVRSVSGIFFLIQMSNCSQSYCETLTKS